MLQRPQQLARIILHGADPDLLEHLGERPLHRAPVFQHIAHPAGAAPVVLQHEIIAVLVPDQIRAAHMDVNILGHVEVHKLAPEMLPRKDVMGRDHPVLQDPLFVIDVVQKKIQGGDALGQAALEIIPLLRGNDPRQQIKREDFLRPRRIPIHVEGDALA